MIGQFSYGYLKEAVKAHLDLEEDELEVLNINQRFHIFANEAIQHISSKKPNSVYFQFQAVDEFPTLVFDDGVLREQLPTDSSNLTVATAEETADWYNAQNIYLTGQVIDMPSNFLLFAPKKAFYWIDSIQNKMDAKAYITYISASEFFVLGAATYLIPYRASWLIFGADDKEDMIVNMPSDLALTIPIYVASVFLQQRNANMAQAKRQEFELAVSRCRSVDFLETKSVSRSFV